MSEVSATPVGCLRLPSRGGAWQTGGVVKKFEADLSNAVWRRSSASETTGTAAVEVALLEGGVAVREARRPEGDVRFLTPAEWDAFVGGAKDGEFDL